jgi:adenylate cyclase
MNSFSAMLDTLNASTPERRPAVEQVILDTFQRRKVVLALDMSGFTLTVRREGILAYLCQIRRMQLLTKPIVLAHQGAVVKNEADNLLAVFDDAAQAVEAALAMLAAAAVAPSGGSSPIAFSIGLDFGEILIIDQVDCFGDAVNLAYKLGEDIARPGEVLVTQRLRDQLDKQTEGAVGPGFALQEMSFSVSGLAVTAYAVSRTPL